MSDHFSAANLGFPDNDARLDLTGLYVFGAPGGPQRTVLIIDAGDRAGQPQPAMTPAHA
jgi:hypothetical protein